jgi:phosphatidylglycerophosphate synthase
MAWVIAIWATAADTALARPAGIAARRAGSAFVGIDTLLSPIFLSDDYAQGGHNAPDLCAASSDVRVDCRAALSTCMGSSMAETDLNRRPIATRSAAWAQRLASALAKSSITPNQISVLSVLFAGIGAALLVWAPTPVGLLLCAVCVQLRLVCNLIDGMVAMEGGKASAVGKIYNEFPDRIADSLLIVALGYACGYAWLGWLGALLAALTAYVRVFGGALGFEQDFRGPFAKQQRMAVLTVGCVAGAAEPFWHAERYALLAAAVIVAAGSLITCITRTLAIAAKLKAAG